jgi:hypothetical protein
MNTDYDWRIQSNCSSTLTSTYLFAPRFNSGNGCATPSGLTSGSYLGNSTQLSWDAGTALLIHCSTKQQLPQPGMKFRIFTNTYSLQNLPQYKLCMESTGGMYGRNTSIYSGEGSFNSGFAPL